MSGKWLEPPRSLLVLLALVTLVSVTALGWLGWRLVEQERVLAEQRSRERFTQTADRITGLARGRFAELGESVAGWLSNPPDANKPEVGVLLITGTRAMQAFPAGRLLYRPDPSPWPDAPSEPFEEIEQLEFQSAKPELAVERYRQLAESGDTSIRAGALMRLGRSLRRSNTAAIGAYQRLAAVSGVRVTGVPAELLARHALWKLGREDGARLKTDLERGRWHITRAQFQFFWGEVSSQAAPDPKLIAYTQAADSVWKARLQETPPRGRRVLMAGGQKLIAIERSADDQRAVLLTEPGAIFQPLGANCWLPEGDVPAPPGAIDLALEPRFTCSVSSTGTVAETRGFLLPALGVMMAFLVAGTYFIGRAIRKESEVARQQSDFVSAVSHEFRTPLTSLLQLSEMLLEGRVPSEERRELYYRTLVQDTQRLQRLVEGLLNFGKMEAGSRQFRRERIDVAELVQQTVAEFRGARVELQGDAGVAVDADREAMSVALRNLVDNALKYSPADSPVKVEWAQRDGALAIAVRDRGPGVAPAERRTIFEKFVRGTAAADGHVKGTGVGLAMVRHIVEAHGGTVRVDGSAGDCVFTILLPVVKE